MPIRPAGAPVLAVAYDQLIFMGQAHGGISRYFVALASGMAENGVAARIHAPFHINAYLRQLPPSIHVGVRLHAKGAARRLGSAIDKLTLPSLLAIGRANILHETYYSRARSLPRKMRFVTTIHDMIPELRPQDFLGDPTAERKAAAIRRADHILCVSENTRSDLIRFYPEVENKITITHLGVVPPSTTVERTKEDHERPYILYVGPRGGYKNFDALLVAFGISDRLCKYFDLICVGGNAFNIEEQERIRRCAPGRVLHREANDVELARLYQGAAVFVYPSLYEGFGIPPLEAMANDCPVVAMRTSSIPEVCGDAVSYAEPGDTDSLVHAIFRVVDDDRNAAELRAAGLERSRLFTWSRCAEGTAAVYRKLV